MTQPSPRGANRRNPVIRFFGEEAATGNPLDLLDLSADALTDAGIVTALDRRLATLASHVECDTPEADEVRLAMHAAAAQLLDPHVRRHLAARWRGGGGDRDSAPSPQHSARYHPDNADTDRADVPLMPSNPRIALEHDVVLAVALHGGWNEKALHHVVSLANARGMSSEDLGRAIAQLHASRRPMSRHTSPTRSSGPATSTNAKHLASYTQHSRPTTSQPTANTQPRESNANFPRTAVGAQVDPAEKALRWTTLLTIGGTALIAIVAFGLAIVLLTPPRPRPNPAPTPDPTATTVAPSPRPTIEPTTPDPAPRAPLNVSDGVFDVSEIVRRLGACAAAADLDPEAAIGEFAQLVEEISLNWQKLKPDQLTSVNHGVVEFIYRIAAGGTATAGITGVGGGDVALDIIAAERTLSLSAGSISADDVSATIWAAGMLSRLGRERDLPATTIMRLRQHLARMFADHGASVSTSTGGGTTFESAAATAVAILPERLSLPQVSLESWQRWLDAVAALSLPAQPSAPSTQQSIAHDRMVLGGLEVLLAHGPDPSRDEATFKAVRLLVTGVSWRNGSESRPWLMARFDDARLTAADLHTITSTIITLPADVDITMVLPVLAADQVRIEMRDRYVSAWGLDPAHTRDELTDAIAIAASTAFVQVDIARTTAEHLACAVRLSRLSEAARWVHRGRNEQASRLVDGIDEGLDAGVTPPASQTTGGNIVTLQRSAQSWTQRYLAAGRSVPVRLSLLDEVAHSIDRDSPDAEVVVSEALRGSPAAVRSRAREIVLGLSQEPAIVAALLETLPMLYETPETSDIIAYVAVSSLPPVTDARWRHASRRALVERLLQLTAGEGEFSRVDTYADLLAQSYMGRAADAPPPTPAQSAAPGPQHSTPSPAPIEISVGRIWTTWRLAVGGGGGVGGGVGGGLGLTLESVERKRAGRLAISRGLVQVFAAHQISVCELMALVIAQERPHHQAEIIALLDTLAQQRRSATSVLKQIQDTEAVMLRLWLMRLGVGGEGAT